MKTLTKTLLPLILTSVAAWAGCSVEDAGSPGPDRDSGIGGKADDIRDDECDASTLDDDGVCRQANGQFAPKECCAAEAECNAAVIDDNGACRSDASGQFVPAACCDAKCENAEIINGFCRDSENGQFVLSACCADKCFDLQTPDFDEDEFPGSCEGNCGGESPDGCFCDDICEEEGDCCSDFVAECPDIATSDDVRDDFSSDEANSCEGACGDSAPSGACFCDEVCDEFGDCCGDKVAHCGGPGSDAVIACEKDECEGTSVDDAGVCRTSGGQFANPACCTVNRCENADLEIAEDGRPLCRDTESGQFVPMTCCAERCENADIDRNGICRNSSNGQFADPSCCADACFRARVRGDVSAIDACNGTQSRPE